MSVQFFQPGADLAATVNWRAIPDNQQRLFDLSLECAEKFDDMLGTNGAWKEPKVELREGQTCNDRELLPGKTVLKNRRLTVQTPGAGDAGPFVQSGFVDEDDVTAISLGFF